MTRQSIYIMYYFFVPPQAVTSFGFEIAFFARDQYDILMNFSIMPRQPSLRFEFFTTFGAHKTGFGMDNANV